VAPSYRLSGMDIRARQPTRTMMKPRINSIGNAWCSRCWDWNDSADKQTAPVHGWNAIKTAHSEAECVPGAVKMSVLVHGFQRPMANHLPYYIRGIEPNGLESERRGQNSVERHGIFAVNVTKRNQEAEAQGCSLPQPFDHKRRFDGGSRSKFAPRCPGR